MDGDSNDRVEQVCEFPPFYGDGERDSEAEFAAVGVGLDFVALRVWRAERGGRGGEVSGREGKKGKEETMNLLRQVEVAFRSDKERGDVVEFVLLLRGQPLPLSVPFSRRKERKKKTTRTHPQIRDVTKRIRIARVVHEDQHVRQLEFLLVSKDFGFVS